MPIKDVTIYPPYWKQFSEYIRFERAKHRCEECRVRNYSVGFRTEKGFEYYGGNMYLDSVSHGFDGYKESKALYDHIMDDFSGGWQERKPTLVILTVAHLDHEGGVCDCKARTGLKCANPAHVKALCQSCHLRLDMPKHIENARRTRAARNDSERRLFADVV